MKGKSIEELLVDLRTELRSRDIVVRESVVLSSGIPSDFYIDVKKAMSDPHIIDTISTILTRKIELSGYEPSFVACSGYGGLPIAAALSIKTGMKLTALRDSPRKHGIKKGEMLEFYIPKKGDLGVIVDDVFTTGSSVLKIYNAVASTGAEITAAYVVIKRGEYPKNFPLRSEHIYEAADIL